MRFGASEQLPVEDWDLVMAANVRGPFLACKEVVPDMMKRKTGAIVNMSSIAGTRSTGARYIPYSASKAAIIGYTRALALEYASFGIRVNCVNGRCSSTRHLDRTRAKNFTFTKSSNTRPGL